jgi:RNA-dependent RNA polymerase
MLKMYARRGQCFTTTKYIAILTPEDIRFGHPDIKRLREDDEEMDPDKPEYYTFTDGCGNISNALCKLINEKFGLRKCSAYQVRLGGAKGVLMFKRFKDPVTGKSLNDQKIVELRSSQLKFKTPDYPLEVIRCATFSQGYLNRQVILLLSNLGVPDEVFIKHLDKAMKSL